MKSLRIYIAGKVSPHSVFGKHDWRDDFCKELSKKSGLIIKNLDPTKSDEDFYLNEKDYMLIFGRDCFMIQLADIVIVNLTDDISVGGSQEMLIAKYFKKPLIGIAPLGGKFRKESKEIRGEEYNDYTDPFVFVPCDVIVNNIDEAAEVMKKLFSEEQGKIKDIKDLGIIDDALSYYKKEHHAKDKFVH